MFVSEKNVLHIHVAVSWSVVDYWPQSRKGRTLVFNTLPARKYHMLEI